MGILQPPNVIMTALEVASDRRVVNQEDSKPAQTLRHREKVALTLVLLAAPVGEHVHHRDRCSSSSGLSLPLQVVLEDNIHRIDVEFKVVVRVTPDKNPGFRLVSALAVGAVMHEGHHHGRRGRSRARESGASFVLELRCSSFRLTACR